MPLPRYPEIKRAHADPEQLSRQRVEWGRVGIQLRKLALETLGDTAVVAAVTGDQVSVIALLVSTDEDDAVATHGLAIPLVVADRFETAFGRAPVAAFVVAVVAGLAEFLDAIAADRSATRRSDA